MSKPRGRGTRDRIVAAALLAFVAFSASSPAAGEKRYDSGASDTEIKIGSIAPYSGPASTYGAMGKVQAAYYKMINEKGGVNGRMITFLSYDDSYSPPKAVENARRLVERDEVLFLSGTIGTASNIAIQRYLNDRKIPHLFVLSGAVRFGEYEKYPWSMSGIPAYQMEGSIYAQHLLKTSPSARIAILHQNDDLGKDLVKGFEKGLGDRVSMIVAKESYEISEPTIDAHIVKLRNSGADTLVNFSTPKPAAQALRRMGELGWKPAQYLSIVATSISGTIEPAGFENAQGILSASYAKDFEDPQWKDAPEARDFFAFLAKYVPEVGTKDFNLKVAYGVAQATVEVIKRCTDDLTRVNVMKQAESFKHYRTDILLPEVTIDTSSTNHFPIDKLRMQKFEGKRWNLFGDVVKGISPSED